MPLPPWAKDGSQYHIRLRALAATPRLLTDPLIAPLLLEAIQFYHLRQRWNCSLVLLMPDHAHALLSFPPDAAMSGIVGAWKAYTARNFGIRWQANYFDHRIRDRHSLQMKAAYILRNPVVNGLCVQEESWPWVWQPTHVE